MKNILVFSTLICLLSVGILSLQAQTTAPEIPYIEVEGKAEKEIIPDEIYIHVVIQERIQGKDKITVEEQETKLIAGLKKIGFPIEQLSLSDANAYYQSSRWRANEVISTKQYELKASSAQMTGSIFKLLDEIDITQAYITKVDHSKIEDFKNELRVTAMKAAKSKSDQMLQAIQHTTGKALIVRENEMHQPMMYQKVMRQDMLYASDSGAEIDQPEVDFRKIKISTSVFVKFQIQ
jgi:uncharacterized protein YggE